LRYVQNLTSNPIVRNFITEWVPTTTGELTGQVYFATVLLFVVVGCVSRRRLTPTEALLALAGAWLGVQSVRAVIWWGFMAAPVLARLLGGVPPPDRLVAWVREHNRPVGGSRALLNGLIAVIWLGALVA